MLSACLVPRLCLLLATMPPEHSSGAACLPLAATPQMGALKEGGFGWLYEMLECFNSGEY